MNYKKVGKYAYDNNEIKDFLEGNGKYNFPNYGGGSTDYDCVLYDGIYGLCEIYDTNMVREKFQNELLQMMEGSVKDLVYSYQYSSMQLFSEENKVAPFDLSEEFYQSLKEKILYRKEELSQFRELREFGGNLPNGSYDYINNLNNIMDSNGNKHIL